MATLTAATAARAATAMARRNNLVDGVTVSFDDLLIEGRISYVRIRSRLGKLEYGVILDDAVLEAHANERADSFAEALAQAPYYDAPKLVTDYLYAQGISRLEFNVSEDDYRIEYAN